MANISNIMASWLQPPERRPSCQRGRGPYFFWQGCGSARKHAKAIRGLRVGSEKHAQTARKRQQPPKTPPELSALFVAHVRRSPCHCHPEAQHPLTGEPFPRRTTVEASAVAAAARSNGTPLCEERGTCDTSLRLCMEALLPQTSPATAPQVPKPRNPGGVLRVRAPSVPGRASGSLAPWLPKQLYDSTSTGKVHVCVCVCVWAD